MSEKEILIKKYPYLSYSKNIIECFSIIGYEEKLLPEIIQDYKNTKTQNHSPTLISSIISDEDFRIIDNDFIISQIFPEKPEFILKSKNQHTSLDIPPLKNIIYAFMTDKPGSTEEEGNKIFYTCFALIYHEPYTYKISSNNNNSETEEYYIPKALCIISQYSFFGFFKYISLNLYKLLLKNLNSNNKISLDIIIYNIVNFTPSPLNYSINYFLFKDVLDVLYYHLPQLSGYPLLDFNIFEIFNIFPVRLFIEIYILTVLEQSILFFSSNLEILNMVMYIFYILNYPCNNSTYFWHIVSILKKDLNEENRFVGQIMTSLLGVNSEYDKSIDTSAFGNYHFIVDIDNKKLIFKTCANPEDNIEMKKMISLQTYIHDIIDEKEVESLFLQKYIERLIKLIENLLKENNIEIQKNKAVNFFENIDRKNNIKFQEYFYNFIINLLLVLYQNINIDITMSYAKIKLHKKLNFKVNNVNKIIKDEEKYFCEFLTTSSKFKLYFEMSIEKSQSNELFKIPLLFSEEYVNVKIKCKHNKIALKLPYFSIIDKLYFPSTKEVKSVHLNHFHFQYSDDKINILSFDKDKKNHFKNIQGKKNLFTFNKELLQNYIYILRNNFTKEELIEKFPSIIIKDENISSIYLKNISEIIQDFFEKNNYIDSSNYLIYSTAYIFIILAPIFSYENLLFYIDKIINCLKKVDFFLRYYINIMIKTFNQYYLINKEEKKYPDMTFDNIKMYIYLLLIVLKEVKIAPDEQMLLIQKSFNSKNIENKQNFEIKTNDNNIELIENTQRKEMNLLNKDNFKIFLKYNFDSNNFYQVNSIISMAMKEKKECSISLMNNTNNDHEKKNVIIVIKIKDKIYSADLLSPKKIFKTIRTEYENLSKNSFSIEKLDKQTLKQVLINLIQYSIELTDLKIPKELFINAINLIIQPDENDYSEKENNSEEKSFYLEWK